jgi:hypothetical protein
MNKVEEKDFVTPGSSRAIDISSISDSSLLVTGHSIDTLNFYNVQSTVIILVSNNCDTIWSTRLHNDSSDVVLDYVCTVEDTIILYGTIGNFINEVTSPSFVKINKNNGNIISVNKLNYDNNNSFKQGRKCVFSTFDSSFYATGITFDSASFSEIFTLSKLDKYLNVIKTKYFSQNIYTQYYNSIDCAATQNHLVFSYSISTIQGNLAIFAKLDTALNIIWSNQFGLTQSYLFDNLHYRTSDSTYILSNYSTIVKLDHIGNVIDQVLVLDITNQPSYSSIINEIIPISNDQIFTITMRASNASTPENLVINKAKIDGKGCSNLSLSLPFQPIILPEQFFSSSLTGDSILQINDLVIGNDTAELILECFTTQSIEEATRNFKIDVYPNPTAGLITINTDKNDIHEIIILNNLGQIVRKHAMNPLVSISNIDLNDIPSGIYFLKFSFNGNLNNSSMKKIIKL